MKNNVFLSPSHRPLRSRTQRGAKKRYFCLEHSASKTIYACCKVLPIYKKRTNVIRSQRDVIPFSVFKSQP